jgi:hypothetical protein
LCSWALLLLVKLGVSDVLLLKISDDLVLLIHDKVQRSNERATREPRPTKRAQERQDS